MKHCSAITKSGRRCKNSIHCSVHSQRGKGIKSVFKGIKERVHAVFKGPRKGPTRRFQNFLDTTGSQRIKSIQVSRKPILSGVHKVLDMISMGNFSKKARELKYDKVYHSYMLVEMEDGSRWKLEKNHVAEVFPAKPSDYENELHQIPLERDLSVKDTIAKASHRDERFWQYNSRQDNCQMFVKEMIEDNGLQPTDPAAVDMLKPQDAGTLIDSLGPVAHLPKIITDAAAHMDHVYYGAGHRKRRLKRK